MLDIENNEDISTRKAGKKKKEAKSKYLKRREKKTSRKTQFTLSLA